MIKTLKLTKFRKAVDDTMAFSEGLNVLRGANEASKTTRLEAIAYALYGAKVLRDSLAQCVTWGHKESELKVELVVEFEGQELCFRRSKAGAEVIKDGVVFVTGQNEVSAFSATLLGADAKTASSLMLADQSGLRGVLEDGPAAVSGLMAKLADFAMIDNIIVEMQNKLLLGSDAPVREKLKQAEADLEEAEKSMPGERATLIAKGEVTLAKNALEKWQKQRLDNEAPAYNLAIEKHNEAEAAALARATAANAVSRAQAKLGQVAGELDTAKRKVVAVDTGRIDTLRRNLFDISELVKRQDEYKRFLMLPAIPEFHWEGGREEFEKELAEKRDALQRVKQGVDALVNKVRNLESQKIDGGVCKTCGTDVSKREDVLEKNAALDKEIANLSAEILAERAIQSALNVEVTNLEEVSRSDRQHLSQIPNTLAPYIQHENATVPSRILWVAEVPDMGEVDANALKKELGTLENAYEASRRAEGEVTALERELTRAQLDLADATARLEVTPDVDVVPFAVAYRKAADALNLIDDKVWKAEQAFNAAKAELDTIEALTASCLSRINTTKERITEYRNDIDSIGFNNSLLKKMRAIKPSVTDYLWNSVLAAVSQFFTQLRGEASVVTKDSDGFKVNGASIKSLSGSTLDVLALAVRVALTKTFIPNSSMLILDECAAACDKDRTSNLLGFLAATHFRQIILASHDELSLSVADNVLDLSN